MGAAAVVAAVEVALLVVATLAVEKPKLNVALVGAAAEVVIAVVAVSVVPNAGVAPPVVPRD